MIGAKELSQGISYVRECLGVDMPYGGVHLKMGTHNHLMRLGDHVFLEVIAVNPDIDSPDRPRWFGLDDPSVRRRISEQPTLLTWVVNTSDIDRFLRQSPISFGKAELVKRADLSWYFSLPDDGRLLAGGMLPYAIEWQTDRHPAVKMADLGCRFQGLEIHHPYPSWFHSILASIGATDLVKIYPLPQDRTSYLTATIDTPWGKKTISSDIGR